MFLFCCFRPSKSKKPSKRKTRRRTRHSKRTQSGQTTAAAAKDISVTSAKPGKPDAIDVAHAGITPSMSVRSEAEMFYDCRDEFSSDGGLSPKHSITSITPRQSLSHEALALNGPDGEQDDYTSEYTTDEADDPETDSGVSAGGPSFPNLMSCLPIVLQKVTSSGGSFPSDRELNGSLRFGGHVKPLAGSSFMRLDPSASPDEAFECWEDGDGTSFKVRSMDYMRTKVKEESSKALYRLIAVDFYSFPTRMNHIAEHVTLPQVQRPYVDANDPTVVIPPLLIINLQLPKYAPSLFGTTDGPGHSMIYYFQLPEDFHPSKVENQAFLQLFERFVSGGREADGTPTRDRLKIIPRVANPEEWLQSGPLSQTEYKLLKNYNEKPVMTKPQHAFYVGPNYLEVDLDIHAYAYLAKRALVSFMSRLSGVVFDNAFVLQGNAPEELPEQVLGCARVHRVDFERIRPFPGLSTSSAGPEPTAV